MSMCTSMVGSMFCSYSYTYSYTPISHLVVRATATRRKIGPDDRQPIPSVGLPIRGTLSAPLSPQPPDFLDGIYRIYGMGRGYPVDPVDPVQLLGRRRLFPCQVLCPLGAAFA